MVATNLGQEASHERQLQLMEQDSSTTSANDSLPGSQSRLAPSSYGGSSQEDR
jgi:hypothetical protein